MAPLVLRNNAGPQRLAHRPPPFSPSPSSSRRVVAARRARFASAFVTAAVEEQAAAAKAEEPAAAPAPAAEEPAAASAQTPSAAATKPSRVDPMKIAASNDATKTAAYLIARLTELPAGSSVLLRAAGGVATTNALKVLARASQILSSQDSSSVIAFQTQRSISRTQGQSRDASRSSEVRVVEFFVQKAPADSFQPEAEDKAALVIRADTESAKVASHAVVNAKRADSSTSSSNSPVALFKAAGGNVPDKVTRMLSGLSLARKELRDRSEDTDLMFTLSRDLYDVEVASRQGQPAVEEEEAGEGEAGIDEEAGNDEPSSSNSSSSDEKTSIKGRSYTIRAYLCKQRTSSRGSRKQDGAESGGRRVRGAAAGKANYRTSRPGFVEVPAEEWAQLKEQLEVVPHLTEQLQIMTRQHEQLLSLLAAQGAATATADGQQNKQQQ